MQLNYTFPIIQLTEIKDIQLFLFFNLKIKNLVSEGLYNNLGSLNNNIYLLCSNSPASEQSSDYMQDLYKKYMNKDYNEFCVEVDKILSKFPDKFILLYNDIPLSCYTI